VNDLTELVLSATPEAWREADRELGGPLAAWLDGALGDAQEARDVIEQASMGWLVDPELAPYKALPWLAELTNTLLLEGDGSYRTQFADPAQRKPGTAMAMERVVRAALGIEARVSPQWEGNRWLTVIQTKESDTPVTGDPIVTWADLMDVCPTPADLIAEGTAEDTAAIDSGRLAPLIALRAQPRVLAAGVRLAHRPLLADSVTLPPADGYYLPPATISFVPATPS
jgi:hypothetical protein